MAAVCSDIRTPLLDDAVNGSVDYRGRPSLRSNSGRWKSAIIIITVEIVERFGFYGISSNLITYLTEVLGQSMASAAENVNFWSGTASLLPLLGGALADSFIGRYRTIVLASALYILGLILLTCSAMNSTTTAATLHGSKNNSTAIRPSPPPLLDIVIFFVSLYLVAFAQGGHKPCIQAFGADQFDGEDVEECKSKCSFFNWWYFGTTAGTFIALIILNYIQDNLSWGLGFGIPCISLVVSLLVFVLGTRTYRFVAVLEASDSEKPLLRIGRVFVNAARNRRIASSSASNLNEAINIVEDEEGHGAMLYYQSSQQLRFLDKALVAQEGLEKNGKQSNIYDVEEAKSIVRLIPIWASSLPYTLVLSQCSTFFIKQGSNMDRSITPNFKIPAASIQCFGCIGVVFFVPIYDRILIPIARTFTLKPSGITKLQRIGVGMFISTVSMIIAALVETKRLKTARQHGLIDDPGATIPISVWWLIPQFILLGVSAVFTVVGLQEFFYDQVSDDLKSVGLGLYLSIHGVGNFLSSFMISVIEEVSGRDGRESWFADNINRAHLDYFYWLLVGISEVGFVVYLYFANSYVYKYTPRR